MGFQEKHSSTLMGLLAILFWSTTIAISRNIIEVMGILNSAFFLFFTSGSLLLIVEFIKYKEKIISIIKTIPVEYFYKVGIFFVSYMVLFYFALGRAASKEAVLVVGLLNYLWPAFCFIFSIIILKNKPRKLLLTIGILISFGGTILALTGTDTFSFTLLKKSTGQNIFPYLLAFFAAISWGAYSNLTRKYQFKNDTIVLPLLFLISSLLIFIIILLEGNLSGLNFIFNLSPSQYFKFLYLILFPSTLSYFFWDRAMKKGNKKLVTSFSYLIPLLSTLTTGFVLDIRIGLNIGIAALLIITGAVFCNIGIREEI
ncbi:MAG: EamA family transporter [Candidatus Aminicenantes bacterium]|nr:EamA family transporter [Candidatus Aminicenantes bacterium]